MGFLQSKILLHVLILLVFFSTMDRVYCAPSATLPESSTCSTERCYQKHLTCPEDCPSRAAANPSRSACFIDCWTQCKAMCKQRKPACNVHGAVCYDPRFVGGDGVMFHFHGRKEENFCIVSDHKVHVNARFMGKRPAGRSHDYTWVQSLGILYESHTLRVEAKRVAVWEDSQDHLDIKFDGMDIYLPQIEGALWASASADVVVERTSSFNVVHVVIENLVEITVNVVPVTVEDDDDEESFLHKNEIPQDDCFAHLHLQFYFMELSKSVDGVLGQTYQSGYKTPVQPSVTSMPTIGEEEKYLSSSLLKADCKVNQFRPPPADVQDTEIMDLVPLNADPFKLAGVRCPSSGVEGLNCRR